MHKLDKAGHSCLKVDIFKSPSTELLTSKMMKFFKKTLSPLAAHNHVL